MDEKLVCILNEMADFLSIAQMKKLQEVLLKNLSSEAPQREQASNETYLNINSRHDDNPALLTTLDAPYDRLKISGVEIRVRELGRKISMERIHPHKFRRTMATRAIDKGMPIEQVQKILGHSQIDTTMQYAIVNQNNVKASHRKYIA